MKEKANIDKITLSYLKLQSPKENRGNILTFFILFLNFFGLFPIIGDPFSLNYFIAAIIPVAIMHIWAIIYIIAPYKFEHSYYLLMGVYGVVNTYVYFLATQKLLYLHMGVISPVPFVVGIVFFIGLLVFMNWLNWKALYSGTYARLQKKGSGNMVWLSIGALGYPIGQLILTFVYSESVQMMIIIMLISVMSIIVAFFSIFIHRYFFIKKNMEIVKQISPGFGLPKEERSEVFKQRLEQRKNTKNPSKKNRQRRNRKRK